AGPPPAFPPRRSSDLASAPSSSAAAAIIPARGFRFAACIVLFPEIVEVEPVVGRIAHMMFQPPGITADERRDGRCALAPRHVDRSEEHTSELQSRENL